MTLTGHASEVLSSHWAVAAISIDDIQRASSIIDQRLAQRAVGQQISFDFVEYEMSDELLRRVLLAYDLAAIEGLDELSRPDGANRNLRMQAMAAASRAFDIRRLLPIPGNTDERLFFVLHVSALAYCGDRWSDLRRWYNEHAEKLEAPSVADVSWDERILFRLFHCWIRLFRKNGWDDLDRIRETIAGLRDDQQTMEARRLQNGSETADRKMALRLIALYHWAKSTETLANYMLQGEPTDLFAQIDRHFEAAVKAATASGDAQLEIILRWLHAAGRIMVTNSLWWTTRNFNSRMPHFVKSLTRREHQPMFELLPPQRTALLEQGLLDQAKTAIVVDLPTSGGKTLLAQFRILQALNQFDIDRGWVAYIAPTRALSAQLTRRLRRDFDPIGIRVEQLSSAVEVDAFEEEILSEGEEPFQILVATPEKLSLVIRNKKVERPLALLVMDEAHNIEDSSRGLRIELLLATVKQDCPQANFLLLMPYVESSENIARWLAQDDNAGQTISLGTTPWKPNERIVGLYSAVSDDTVRAGWRLEFETLESTERAMSLRGIHRVGGLKPIDVPRSKVVSQGKQTGFGLQTAAIGTVMSARGTSITVSNRIRTVWSMAEEAAKKLPFLDPIPEDIVLAQDFLRTEISSNFQLVETLNHGVGVHHAGLSDEVRALMEWLAESGSLRMLCATSTIAQGINFPVSSVFLASRFLPSSGHSTEMSARDFWNLAGRAGRIGHDSVGVVGLAEGTDRDAQIRFISRNTGALVSRLVTLIDEVVTSGNLANLSAILRRDQWEDFRCYIAHLWSEKRSLDAVLAESEHVLRQTYGYSTLRNSPDARAKADALLEATRSYARELDGKRSGVVDLADSTGFSPEGIEAAMRGMSNLENRLTPDDWSPDSLFGDGGQMSDLFGVMLNVPQLKEQLEEIGGQGFDHSRISEITRDWVNGRSLNDIANEYFNRQNDSDGTLAIGDACRAIYRSIANNGTWGVSALSRIAGIDFDALPETDRRRINALPAMIYHGVRSEDAVLMRMNAAPRSAAEALGDMYRVLNGDDDSRFSVGKARKFLKDLSASDWDLVRPTDSALTGSNYKRVWGILSGEEG